MHYRNLALAIDAARNMVCLSVCLTHG